MPQSPSPHRPYAAVAAILGVLSIAGLAYVLIYGGITGNYPIGAMIGSLIGVGSVLIWTYQTRPKPPPDE